MKSNNSILEDKIKNENKQKASQPMALNIATPKRNVHTLILKDNVVFSSERCEQLSR